MQLFYFKAAGGNFGDDLNPWLWPRLLGEVLDDDASTLFVGIGTLLNHRIPAQPRKVVFGTGAGYGSLPQLDGRFRFYCVRGPLTAQALGLDADLAVTDPAALIASVELPSVSTGGGVAYMPHVSSVLRGDWAAVCTTAGLRFIDPRWPVNTVLEEIRRSELLLAEAMHGAIVADALRIPWAPVACYGEVFEFKWRDWCASLGLDYVPARLAGVWDAERHLPLSAQLKNRVKRTLRSAGWQGAWDPPPPARSGRRHFERVAGELAHLARTAVPMLSEASRLRRAVERLTELLHQLKRDQRSARSPVSELPQGTNETAALSRPAAPG
jgi:succinoglycan biosynthesis protein ExoV